MQLGSKLTVTAVLHRRTQYQWSERYKMNERVKVWEPWPISPRAALFLGYRTLSNGAAEWEDEAGYIFTPASHFKAALVCFSTREKPVYVPLESMQEETRV